jgi:hypothetical protein
LTTETERELVTVNMEEVHKTSLDILELLEEDDVELKLGLVAIALTFGRVASPKVLTQEEEVKFLENILEYIGLYFVEGEPN